MKSDWLSMAAIFTLVGVTMLWIWLITLGIL
jgi:hypothetical protein